MKDIHWIFFDLDDTLWNFSYNSHLSLKFMYENFPIISEIFNLEERFIEEYHKNNAALWEAFSRNEVTSEQLRVERWRSTLFPKVRDNEVIKICEELDFNYLNRLAQFPNLLEGAKEMLDDLTKSFLISIISNGFLKTQYSKITYSGLWRYITRLIVSEEIGQNKPHPDIYRYAVEETGAKGPLLMIGDNLYADVLGAMKSGWNAIWFNPERKIFPYSSDDLKDMEINPELLIGITVNIEETHKLILRFFNQQK